MPRNRKRFPLVVPDILPEAGIFPAQTPSTEAVSRLVAGKQIEGVELRRLRMNHDARGCFTEVFQEHWGTCIKPVQWSIVHSKFNVFRGMYLHRRHDEYISVITGRASVGLRDLRPWSPTKNTWSLYELHGSDLTCISFPIGLLHGWYFHEPSIHLQAVSEAYVDYGKVDNWRCRWSDPALEISWPFTDPILAKYASDFPTLVELEAALGEWGQRPPR
jgi:dTDP-4-dehydrorhamnose 3,5-epimerase